MNTAYTNTRDNEITFLDAMLYVMEGESPSKAIENQERRGQVEVVRAQRLPKKLNSTTLPNDIFFRGVTDDMCWKEREAVITANNIEYTREQYEKMGIEIISECDELFWNVSLPEGWEIKATEHSMWNDLFDEQGRKRANFFYKAAFYDRDAFINFNTRFHVGVDHVADPADDYEIWKNSDYQGTVKDGTEVIFCTGCFPVTGSYYGDDSLKEKLRETLEDFMRKYYPDYKNIHAYWD